MNSMSSGKESWSSLFTSRVRKHQKFWIFEISEKHQYIEYGIIFRLHKCGKFLHFKNEINIENVQKQD